MAIAALVSRIVPRSTGSLAGHAISPVAGQRDDRRVSDQMVEDHIVLERQPIDGCAGWRSHGQCHPHVGLLLVDRDHVEHLHSPGPPIGSDRANMRENVILEFSTVLPHRLDGVHGQRLFPAHRQLADR